MMENFYILILPSIHYVMKVEKEALAQGIEVNLVPVPRQISSDCGMVVKFHEKDLDWILALMSSAGMPEGTIHWFNKDHYEFLSIAGKK